MLKKGKGVERSTSSWKQQMRERKQVFQWSGVTVLEDQCEDSMNQELDDADEGDEEVSRGGDTSEGTAPAIAVHTPKTTVAPPTIQPPEIIDCTEPEIIDCTGPFQNQESYQQSVPITSAIYEFQNAMRALEEQLQGNGDDDADADDQDDDDDDMQSVCSIRSLSSAVYPSAPERQEQTRLQANRRLLIQTLEATFNKGFDPYERCTITTMGRAGLDPPKQAKNEYFTVFQRFQRSRLARELAITVALLPTKHFHVVDGNLEVKSCATPKPVATMDLTAPQKPDVTEILAEDDRESSVVSQGLETATMNSMASSPPKEKPKDVQQMDGITNQTEIISSALGTDEQKADQAEPSVHSIKSAPSHESTVDEQSTCHPEITALDSSAHVEFSDPDVSDVVVETTADNSTNVVFESSTPSNSTTDPVSNEPAEAQIQIQQNADTSETLEVGQTEVMPCQSIESSATFGETKPLFIQVESAGSQEDGMQSPFVDQPTDDNSPSATKKSKADKWKDRLAKRKNLSKKDSDVSNESPADSPANRQPATPPPQLPQSDCNPVSPPTDDTTPNNKEKRKSLKWKQRLAEKKSSKSSPAAPVHKTLSTNVDDIVEEEIQRVIEKESPKGVAGEKILENEPVCEIVNAHSSTTPIQQEEQVEETFDKQTEEKKPNALVSDSTPEPALKATPKEAEKPAVRPAELQNSFMVFDALLRQRQGISTVDDGDEYSEYTIEETVLLPAAPTKAERLEGGQPQVTVAKLSDSESQYEEITVEQSYMELTVDDDQDSNDSSQDHPNPTATPIHAATANLMNSRMFSTPQVAKEPTITVEHVSDDEMTQLTFDQSYAEPVRKAPEPLPVVIDKMNDSAKDSIKDTIGSGSMHGSRKRDSVNGSHLSFGSKTSSASDKTNKRISDILRKDIWSRDANVVQEALESIVAEASRGQKARAKISQFGGVMGIVRAMESHRDVAFVQVAGCNALDRLALDAETQVVIGEMGGIAVILDAMKAFESHEGVHEAACAALANVTRHRGTTDEVEGAVQVLCASMNRHSKNMLVQSKAFGTIANICMDNKDRLQELSDSGGMLAMTMALQQPWPNKAEKHEAISNLSILLRCLAEHEEGNHDEEYDGYPEHDGESDDQMSVVSALEDEGFAPPEGDDGKNKKNINEGSLTTGERTNPAASEGPSTESTEVQSLQKLPRTELLKDSTKALGLEQGSNSTQPTEPTSRGEADDENCIVS